MNQLDEIDLNITDRCNMDCSHCLFSAGSARKDDLPLTSIERTLQAGRRLGAHEVHITGGEPLVRKDLTTILNMAHAQGYFVRLQTNLWACTSDLINQIRETTPEILTSLDGLEKSHDLVRRQGSFARAVRWIRKLLDEGFRVVVITAVQTKNYSDIIPLVDFLQTLGVHAHILFSVTPLGRAKEEDVVDLIMWERLLVGLRMRYGSCDSKTDIICELRQLGAADAINFLERDCRLNTRNHAVVLATGEIYPCSLFTVTDRTLGNLLDADLQDIWLNSPQWDFYGIANRDTECSTCDKWNYCKGGCRGYAYLLSHDISKKDPRCIKDAYPVCQSWKLNIRNLDLASFTWKVMKRNKVDSRG